ncbi:MAG TPA: SPFH domain-containing protein [Spirochaetota bacterium]
MALIDVVQWSGGKGELIYRFPEGAISLGGQLIVAENQEAILFKEGRALDSFAPGRHTLKTGNIPILEKLINLPFGGSTPFPAEIYFINKTEVPGLKWGTKQPIQLIDPVYNVGVPVRAFGSYSIRVKDARSLLLAAIGSWQAFTTDKIGEAIRDLAILTKLQDFISETLYKQNITLLKIATQLEEISAAGKAKLTTDFESFGLELVRFAVESINLPEEDESFKRLKKALADKAEIDILGTDTYKLKRTFDTMEKAASAEGGNLTGAGMGLGMGAGLGAMMPGMMKDAITGQGNAAQASVAPSVICPECKAENKAGAKFCASCGKEMVSAKCPKCNAALSAGAKFCPECGTPVGARNCTKCNAKLEPGAKFCPECGEKA